MSAAVGGATMEWVAPMMMDKFTGPNSGRLLFAVSVSTAAILGAKQFAPGQEAKKDVLASAKGTITARANKTKDGKHASKATRVAVDKTFLRHFRKLLAIAFPTLKSEQGAYLAGLSVLLLLRTWLSLKTTSCMGSIAKKMVETEVKPLAIAIAKLAFWSVPAAAVNSGMKYTTSILQLSFRKNLTKHFHQKYLCQQNFFKSVGLGAVDSVDQRVTSDVQKFSDEAAEIYSTLFKPIIDICLFAKKVSEFGGWRGPALIIAYYGMITFVIRALAPNFGLLTSIQQQREGKLRTAHNRVIEYAEEVTMSQGEKRSLATLNGLFERAHLHYLYTAYLKSNNYVLDGILVKYGSVMAGYAVCGLSIFSAEASKMDSSALTGLYIHTSQLLVNLARAIGQLIMTYKTVASLAGYTQRVYQLEDSLSQVDKEKKKSASAPSSPAAGGKKPLGEVVSGCTGISFSDVPIISPDNTVLVENMNFHVNPGMNLLIVGPNGCGKSSTFRLLGELWPAYGGKIEKPSFEHLYYVPQRPYMSSGTLRDQLIYPTRARDVKVGDADLFECLRKAKLEGLLDQPGVSWDARQNWAGEALSQGQKQKLAMARLFFHRPRFAILDECTSAIDIDIEQHLYTQCKELGISLITIAHRRSLWKYHNWVLRFDGDRGYMFSPLQFTENQDMILTKVMHSSDESKLGQRIVIDTSKSENKLPDEVAQAKAKKAAEEAAAAEMEAAAAKKKAEEEAAKKAEAEAIAKQKAEAEAAAQKKAEEEAAAKKRAEEEAAKKKAEEEAAAQKKAEEEAAAKKKADEEAAAEKAAAEKALALKAEEEAAEAKKKEEASAQKLPSDGDSWVKPDAPKDEDDEIVVLAPEPEAKQPAAESKQEDASPSASPETSQHRSSSTPNHPPRRGGKRNKNKNKGNHPA